MRSKKREGWGQAGWHEGGTREDGEGEERMEMRTKAWVGGQSRLGMYKQKKARVD